MKHRVGKHTWVAIVVTGALLSSLSNALSVVAAGPLDPLKLDWQGDVRWSRYNFTDITKPYNAADTWTELKAAYFLDQERKIFAPYGSLLGVWSTGDDDQPSSGAFDWQRNAELRLGLQYYPLANQAEWVKAVRLYGYYARRVYASDTLDLEKNDWRGGFDYYVDNIRGEDLIVVSAYANCAYRKTNFSLDDYNAVLGEFNLKVGPRVRNLPVLGRSQLVPYAFLEGSYVPAYDERWWENYLRAGVGARLYCFDPNRDDTGFWAEFRRRVNIYAEYVRNVAWLGDNPGDTVEDYDYRFGISYATGGFFNETRPEDK